MNDVHDAVGSYAVDALSPGERDEFETHLAGCLSCRREVAQFSETLARLTPLSAAAPPASLRATILGAVADTRQSAARPAVAARADERTSLLGDGRPEAAPRRAKPAQVTELRPLEPDEVAPLEEHPSVVPDTPWVEIAAGLREDLSAPPPNRRREHLLTAMVAASIIVILFLSGWVYLSQEQQQAQVARAEREVPVLTAPDAEVYAGTADGEPISFVVSQERGQAVFVGDGLPVPAKGKAYQLWVLRDDNATSAGLVPEGALRALVSMTVEVGDELAISLEPEGGSPTPTTVLGGAEVPSE